MMKAIIATKKETTADQILQNLASEHFDALFAAIEERTPVANNPAMVIKVDITTPIYNISP